MDGPAWGTRVRDPGDTCKCLYGGAAYCQVKVSDDDDYCYIVMVMEKVAVTMVVVVVVVMVTLANAFILMVVHIAP